MYMSDYKKYSSTEAYEVAEMAKAKGLTLLEGNYKGCSCYPDMGREDCRGFCVSKVIAGEYLTLCEDGTVHQEHVRDGSCMSRTVWFRLTLDEAKEQIINFDGTIKNPPHYFAYVRVYEDEPEYYANLQILYLEEFARKYGITYKERFVCIGGHRDTASHPEDCKGINEILKCCEESFNKMDKDSYLVITDIFRLNDNIDMWRQAFDIVPIGFDGLDYRKYIYLESQELKNSMQKYDEWDDERDDWDDEWEKDSEYEQMTQEHREMMLQDDQPFIEVVEEDE